MKGTGLAKKQVEEIRKIFRRFPEIQKVILFGSRAKGNYRENSDVDLALIGAKGYAVDVGLLLSEFDESDIPYLVDIVDFNTIQNDDLRDHILRVGVLLYQK